MAHPQGSDQEDDISKVASALIVSACDKAGMNGIDRSKIDAIIMRESGNSAYMQQQRKRDQQVNRRIEKMLVDLNKKKGAYDSKGICWKQMVERELEDQIEKSIRNRPTRSCCCVVDMDMFYVACELLSRPELSQKPCCVGQGMVTTSNYVARKYGVRSAMAGFIADKLVDELSGGKEKLVHLPLNFALYSQQAQNVRLVLSEYDPCMKSFSLDEGLLNIGPYVAMRLAGLTHSDIVSLRIQERKSNSSTLSQKMDSADPLAEYASHVVMEASAEIVKEIRQRVFEATRGLTCSAGLAPNFMLAKMASDANKPDGQLLIGPSHDEVLAFLHPLSTRKVGGIGRVTEKILHSIGVRTVGDLYEQRALVSLCFTQITANFLVNAAVGCSNVFADDDDFDESLGRKGISRERTFEVGRPWSEVVEKLEAIVKILGDDMRSKFLLPRTVTLKVKLHTFDVLSRARTLPRGKYVQSNADMINITNGLLHDIRRQCKGKVFSVRLLGVRCSNFQGEHDRNNSMQMNIKPYLSKYAARRSDASSESSFSMENHVELSDLCQNRSLDRGRTNAVHELKSGSSRQTNLLNEEVRCPLCQKPFHEKDNIDLNMHIDVCLNMQMIQDVSRREVSSEKPRKKSRLMDFFPGKYQEFSDEAKIVLSDSS